MLNLKVKKLTPSTLLPKRATTGAAGYDLYSPEKFTLNQGELATIDIGLSFEIPVGYYLSIVPRSSMGKKGIIIPNSPATIDEDYRGYISVMLWNIGKGSYVIEKGDRIAQLLLLPYNEFELDEVATLSPTERGSGGFGSTGK